MDKAFFEIYALTMRRIVEMAVSDDNKNALNEIGKEISIAVFEKQYGSTLCSYQDVGKAKTIKRIKECNSVAEAIVRTSLSLLEKMTTEQIKMLF